MLIAIAGGTGSGKTTLTKKLYERFPDDITVVYHDNYYKSHPNTTYEERAKQNYDHPDAFDNELFLDHIKKLIAGEAVECPVYDYTVHDRSDQTITITPTPIIVVEGILILANEEIRRLADIKIFVDTDADERILRRMKRDVEKRGRSMTSVMEQYLSTVKPMHELYVEPSKKFADIVVVGGGKNLVALDMITSRIDNALCEISKK